VVRDGFVYFTTVDGQIVVADTSTLKVVDKIVLDPGERQRGSLGWCRGLLLDGDYCWVGFTRIRPTKFRSALSWVRTAHVAAPTRLSRFRLSDGYLEAEMDLESANLNAIFGVSFL
ncbi:MAG: hypothetical protein M3439_10875, partial [Chloroflexota bacterium]|nr:hypothetical protein [Chloroflexota bacterium]